MLRHIAYTQYAIIQTAYMGTARRHRRPHTHTHTRSHARNDTAAPPHTYALVTRNRKTHTRCGAVRTHRPEWGWIERIHHPLTERMGGRGFCGIGCVITRVAGRPKTQKNNKRKLQREMGRNFRDGKTHDKNVGQPDSKANPEQIH